MHLSGMAPSRRFLESRGSGRSGTPWGWSLVTPFVLTVSSWWKARRRPGSCGEAAALFFLLVRRGRVAFWGGGGNPSRVRSRIPSVPAAGVGRFPLRRPRRGLGEPHHLGDGGLGNRRGMGALRVGLLERGPPSDLELRERERGDDSAPGGGGDAKAGGPRRSGTRAIPDYRTLIEQAADGIFSTDAQGRLTDANSRGCDMLGPRAQTRCSAWSSPISRSLETGTASAPSSLSLAAGRGRDLVLARAAGRRREDVSRRGEHQASGRRPNPGLRARRDRAPRSRGTAQPVAEDGGGGRSRGRHRPRLQQPAHRDHRPQRLRADAASAGSTKCAPTSRR